MGHESHAVLVSLATAIAGGVLLVALARQANLPTILVLLVGGVLLGPEGIGWVRPDEFEAFLPVIVSLSVALILFEGGITLDLRGYAQAGSVIRRMLSLGVLVTWLGTALAAYLLYWGDDRMDISFALLMGSMVVVTGPTVIVPLLKRIRLSHRLHHILHWEGVLIDAIGVFTAILCFEWVSGHGGGMAVADFGARVLLGLGCGLAGGALMYWAIKHRFVPEQMFNVFALGGAVAVYGVTESLMAEAGLLSVVVSGLFLGWRKPVELKEIRRFKGEIIELLIGLLFIILAARLDLAGFAGFWQEPGAWLVIIVMLVIRPLAVGVSAAGSDLTWRERLFLSWVAPRGIVSASMASLFALALAATAAPGRAELLETFTYSVIVTTVVLQGFSAGWLARILGLQRPDPTGWLVVGAHRFGREMTRILGEEAKLPVLLIDTNRRLVGEAATENYNALPENAFNLEVLDDRVEFQNVGRMLALTDNAEMNELLCTRWADPLGRDHVYRWSPETPTAPGESNAGRVTFAGIGRPSVVSTELEEAEARIDRVECSSAEMDFDGTPLIVLRNERAYMAGTSNDSKPKEGDVVFVLRRPGGSLWRSIEAGGIHFIEASNIGNAYAQLIQIVAEKFPKISADEALKELLERERHIPSYLGHGIALPHLHLSQINRRICLVGRLKKPITPEGGEPVSMVFLLLSPAGDPERHLAALGEIARLCSDDRIRSKMELSASVSDLTKFLRRRLRGQ